MLGVILVCGIKAMGRPGVDDIQVAFGHGISGIIVNMVAFSVADIGDFNEIKGMQIKVRKVGVLIFADK